MMHPSLADMRPSMAAIMLSQKFEALRLFAYPDPESELARATPELRKRWGFEDGAKLLADLDDARRKLSGAPWTIGWGHAHDVEPGDRVTEHQADVVHESDLGLSWSEARAVIEIPLTQGMVDAITTFVNNVGMGAKDIKDGFCTLRSGRRSTILTLLNAGIYVGARGQLLTWVHANGQVVDGLKNRRRAEFALWGDAIPAQGS